MNAQRKSGRGECLKNCVWCAPLRGSHHPDTLKCGHPTAARSHKGFTLVELLVVIAVIALLGVVLLPVLADTRPNSRAFQCENNTRRLMQAWLMYGTDNGDKLILGIGGTIWISNALLDWGNASANTNAAALLDPSVSLIANYIRSASVFKCPADIYPAANGPRVRSYTLNAAVGGNINALNQTPGRTYFSAKKMADLNTPGPARIWVFVDEHPDSIDDPNFHLDPGQPVASIYWRNMPASFHNGAYGVSFADGRSDIVRLVEFGGTGRRTSLLPIVPLNAYLFRNNYNSSPYFSGTHYLVGDSYDYQWLNDGMPYRLN